MNEKKKMNSLPEYDYLGASSAQDCTGLIPSLPTKKEEIESYTRNLLDEAGTTGVIIGADCTIPEDTSLERLEWVRQAAALPWDNRGRTAPAGAHAPSPPGRRSGAALAGRRGISADVPW